MAADWVPRVLSNVVPGDMFQCWPWQGYKDPNGYGRTWRNGRKEKAHRLVWEAMSGPIPEGLFVCHHCDNPGCVNPSHLFLGTNKDNIHDALSKGRLYAQKITHCPQGHSYADHSMPDGKRGGRKCRLCDNARRRARAKRLRLLCRSAPPEDGK